MSAYAQEMIELISAEERPAEPRELFCKDFDLGCFDVEDTLVCKLGTSAVIEQIRYYTLPIKAICPLCERLL